MVLGLLGMAALAGPPSRHCAAEIAAGAGVEFPPTDSLANGKHIVFIAGDEEYRSEESMPQLAKILAVHHGFRGTVLFSQHPQTGDIDPSILNNIPGLEVLQRADLIVMFTRFLALPDDQMRHLVDYTESGKPIIGVRTATHAFRYDPPGTSPYAKWSYNSTDPPGGWGRRVLGETWIRHYGDHGRESTRGVIADDMREHPIVRGCEDIWGPSDVYGLTTLPETCQPLIMGQVLKGMNPTDVPNPDKPAIPVAWTNRLRTDSGREARVFATTMGHGDDFRSEGFRRLLVNACYWCLEMETKIPPQSCVDLVGEYPNVPSVFGKYRRGVKPADHSLTR